MNREELFQLAEKISNGTANDQEIALYNAYYMHFQKNQAGWDTQSMGNRELVEQKLLDNIHRKTFDNRFFMRRIFLTRTSAAAAIIILLSIGSYFYLKPPKDLKPEIVKLKLNDIAPGTNKAILTLKDGKKIVLDNVKQGILVNQGGIAIKKSRDGQLIYDVSGISASELQAKTVYNTISTPRGGQFQVVLPDGTLVWLNAASSLRFPVAFNGKTRNVELHGEAYFEVTKNKNMPFHVDAGTSKIEVLGTHFNINAYKDENTNTTTLIEGLVKVSTENESIVITPGNQAQITNGNPKIKVNSADQEEVLAWKNGYFMFVEENIHGIMRKLSRWYNIDVQFDDPDINENFGGTISKYKNISEVLNVMEKTGTIHFKIIPGDASGNGRRVIVMR